MTDATLATLGTTESLTNDLRAGFTAALDALTRLEQNARGTEKAKWSRLARKVHSVVNHADRVLQGT